MTETQAKSGATGTSTPPGDEEVADGGSPATGRAAVGRAVVPAGRGVEAATFAVAAELIARVSRFRDSVAGSWTRRSPS